ncbi:MAG TPA: GNAT family N-acetyltransferase [Candidatus Limnocylindria bacterium]|nr:GNAT family N-acetyltransferase [Candidatus Limnocylindria bacterium]
MTRRHLVADLGEVEPRPLQLTVRTAERSARTALAELMLDAYQGTIDADGSETLDVAQGEIDHYLRGGSGRPMLGHSRLAYDGERLVSAVLVSEFEGTPLIAYVCTASDHKGRGLADGLVRLAMRSLAQAGHRRVHLWVTAGNEPAERIYERLGFHGVGDANVRADQA